MRGRGFQVKVSKSTDLYLQGTEVCPSTGLARNLFKWENHVFSYCFTMVPEHLGDPASVFNSSFAKVTIRIVHPANTDRRTK